jgi:NADH dehydrogenase [ubiquinone] 1 alpha subcomplex assembly factor 7
MIEVRNVRRAAIDRWLRVARLPFDTVAHLLPSDRGPRNAAMLVIDRADASVRAAVAEFLRDDDLRADAFRRRAAVDERERAAELRIAAEEKKRVSDAELAHELDGAARLREEAARDAEIRAREADEERSRRQRQARQTAAAQARVVDDVAAEQLASVEKQAKRERLNVLDEQADALDTEADALVATDEAQRLRDAARAAKATRKGTA